MFCGFGHPCWCKCEVCSGIWVKSPRYRSREKSRIQNQSRQKEIDDVLRRPKPGEALGPTEAPFRDELFQKQYPLLHAHLADVHYDDRAPRATSTLLVFCDNSVLRLCLNDRDNNRSVFVTGETLDDALNSLELGLASGRLDWRKRGSHSNGHPATPF